MLDSISKFIASLPPYIGQGMVSMLVTIVSTLVLGYVTARVFNKIGELTRVKGVLLEKRITVYQEMFTKVEHLMQLEVYSPDDCKVAIELIKESQFDCPKHLQIPIFMDNPEKMSKTILTIDEYLTEKKMICDPIVDLAIMRITNYLAIYSRLLSIFRAAVADSGNESLKKKIEQQLFVAIGLIGLNDLANECNKFNLSIKEGLNNLNFKFRKAPTYRYEDMNSPYNAVVMDLQKTLLFKEHSKITAMVNVAVAMCKEPI